MQYVAAAVYSYLLGAIPSAYIVGKWRGIDITGEGSGNIGGTNAYRVLGPKLGLLVAVMDVGKALLALTVTRLWLGTVPAMFVAVLAAVIGHNWSIYVGFRGGKGIAVSIGSYFYLFPGLAGPAILAAIFNVLVTKYVSLGSLNFLLVMAVLLTLAETAVWYKVLGILLLLIGIYRHRSNIVALRSGTERRFGQ